MKHFIFLFHMITFLVGFVGIISALFAYIKYPIKLIKYYIIFIVALTIILLEQTIISYEMINIVEFFWLNVLLNSGEYVSSGLIIYFLPLFVHELTKSVWTKKKRSIFIGLVVLQAILWAMHYLTLYKKLLTLLASSLLFLVIIYCIVFLVIRFNTIKETSIKRALKLFTLITILFLPYMYLDTRAEHIEVLNRLFPYGLLSVPIFYMLWNLVSIYLGVKWMKAYGKVSDIMSHEDFFERFNITKREKEIILLLVKGYSYNQLAEELVISVTTVKTHIHNIYKKVGVKNKIELIHLMNKEKEREEG